MTACWRQIGITILVVTTLVGQMLAWAVHTHAHAEHFIAPLQCKTILHAAGKVPCDHPDQEETCPICWSHACAGAALPTPPLFGPCPSAKVLETLQVGPARLLIPATQVAGYRSRAPPENATSQRQPFLQNESRPPRVDT